MPYITTQDGTAIYYKDWGTGIPVILIHGWPATADMWESQAVYLAENGCRVISYDRRGFGRSSQPWSGYDYDTLTSDLAALIDALKLEQVVLVGFSMGGGEVARYIATYGEAKVAKAVLVSAVTPYLLKTEDNSDGVDGSVFDGILSAIKQDRAAFMKEFALKFYGRSLVKHSVSESVLDWFSLMALQASPKATTQCAVAWSTTDFRSDLTKFTVPTLIIHGTGDTTVPAKVSGQRVAKIIPGASFVEYDGEPHGLFVTAKDRLNQDLLNFIKSGTVVRPVI